MKEKKKKIGIPKGSLILWLFCLATYIFNIVVVAINGADLFSNIMGWGCCIVLVIAILVLEKANCHTLEMWRNSIEVFDMLLEQKDKEKGGQE